MLKYDTWKTLITVPLLQAVEDINVAVEAVICARVKDHGPPPDHDNFQWIVSCRDTVVKQLDSTGVSEGLDSAVDWYNRLVVALGEARVPCARWS